MDRVDKQLSSFVLAQIEWQLDKISEEQHRLARKKALLREQATRLRLGEPPAEIRLPAPAMMARDVVLLDGRLGDSSIWRSRGNRGSSSGMADAGRVFTR